MLVGITTKLECTVRQFNRLIPGMKNKTTLEHTQRSHSLTPAEGSVGLEVIVHQGGCILRVSTGVIYSRRTSRRLLVHDGSHRGSFGMSGRSVTCGARRYAPCSSGPTGTLALITETSGVYHELQFQHQLLSGLQALSTAVFVVCIRSPAFKRVFSEKGFCRRPWPPFHLARVSCGLPSTAVISGLLGPSTTMYRHQ